MQNLVLFGVAMLIVVVSVADSFSQYARNLFEGIAD